MNLVLWNNFGLKHFDVSSADTVECSESIRWTRIHWNPTSTVHCQLTGILRWQVHLLTWPVHSEGFLGTFKLKGSFGKLTVEAHSGKHRKCFLSRKSFFWALYKIGLLSSWVAVAHLIFLAISSGRSCWRFRYLSICDLRAEKTTRTLNFSRL